MKGDTRPVKNPRASSPTCSHAFVPYSIGTSTNVQFSKCCRISYTIYACVHTYLSGAKNMQTQIHLHTTYRRTCTHTTYTYCTDLQTHIVAHSRKHLFVGGVGTIQQPLFRVALTKFGRNLDSTSFCIVLFVIRTRLLSTKPGLQPKSRR